MKEIIRHIHETLDVGIMSDEFDFTTEGMEKRRKSKIDMSKLQYQAFFRTFEYQKSKIPSGLHYLPGMDEIIKQNMINSTTPLEEYAEKFQEKFNSSSRL